VIWTKPDDLTVDMKKPFNGLVRTGQDFALVAMGDGSTQRIKHAAQPINLARAFGREDGEIIDFEDLTNAKPAGSTPKTIPGRPKTAVEFSNDMKQIGL